jgi:hypothetical protein
MCIDVREYVDACVSARSGLQISVGMPMNAFYGPWPCARSAPNFLVTFSLVSFRPCASTEIKYDEAF